MSEVTLGEVAIAAIARDVERLLRNDALLREGQEGAIEADDTLLGEGEESSIEAVHQMRVATRRLRSDLRTFRSALDRRRAKELREELGWLAGLLGAARDADVLCERLSARSQELNRESRRAAMQVLRALGEQRASAHAALAKALSGERCGVLLERLRAYAGSPALSLAEADRPANEALPHVLQRSWRRLARQVESLAQPPGDAELHEVRIAAKRCRYAAEACAPVLGEPAARLARACKALQTVLGELNDAVVAERWLRHWAADPEASSAARTVAEELARLERESARRARARWRKAWERTLKEARPAG